MHKDCMQCGNPVDKELTTCVHCGYELSRLPARTKVVIRTVNIKESMPGAEEARARLREELGSAAGAKVRALKVVHGYGSTGKGGKLRHVVRRVLADMQNTGSVFAVIPGEEWAPGNAKAKSAIRRIPKLKSDPDYNKRNQGITLVIL